MLQSSALTRIRLCQFIVVAAAALLPVQAYAVTMPGSEGRVNLTGNDGAATGSFSVDIAYEVFNGLSATDPLGITGAPQIAFVLKHNGSGGEAPTLKIGRFSVFAPAGAPIAPYYASGTRINPASAGLFDIGPSGNGLDPFGGQTSATPQINASPNRAIFQFVNGLSQANFPASFSSGPQYSRMLVLTLTPSATLPSSVILEIDGTDTVPQVHADTTITLTPEPGTCGLVALGLLALARRGRAALAR